MCVATATPAKNLANNTDNLIYYNQFCKKGVFREPLPGDILYMAISDRSQYQKAVINRYYQNLDAIMLGKLSELVSELYLAQTDARRKQLWQRAQKAMIKLKIKPGLIEHIMEKRDVEILARNLAEWLAN